jgi:hypothetical protein
MLAVETQVKPTNVHLPLLPFKHMPIYLETNTFGLYNMQRLRCLALFPFLAISLCVLLYEVREEVLTCERRRNPRTLWMFQGVLIQRRRLCWCGYVGIGARDVYVDDLTCENVDYRDEVLLVLFAMRAIHVREVLYQRVRIQVLMFWEARKH